MIEIVVELPVGLIFIYFGLTFIHPSRWWLNSIGGFQNSPSDLYTINAEAHSWSAAVIIGIVCGLGFIARATWLLWIRRRDTIHRDF